MKNSSINGLVAILLGLFLVESVPYVSIGLTIYGLYLANNVLKVKENTKINRIISIISYIIGIPLIILLFIIFFKSIF